MDGRVFGMPKEYLLFLDESETHTHFKNKVFCIAGIIVEKNFHDNVLKNEINDIKELIWGLNAVDNNKYILHEKDIKEVQNKNNYKPKVDPIYHAFKYPRNTNVLNKGLKKILGFEEVTVIGACVVNDEISKHYHDDIITKRELIAMQVILENFCHFLQRNNGYGNVYYESIGIVENNRMRRRFNLIEVMGTMYVSSEAIQQRIINIHFPLKQDNVPGLQVADFIPNSIARKVAKKKKRKPNIDNDIRLARYDGGIMKHDKFGVKVIPKI
jgi:Protein of unknown function (DUF3800)